MVYKIISMINILVTIHWFALHEETLRRNWKKVASRSINLSNPKSSYLRGDGSYPPPPSGIFSNCWAFRKPLFCICKWKWWLLMTVVSAVSPSLRASHEADCSPWKLMLWWEPAASGCRLLCFCCNLVCVHPPHHPPLGYPALYECSQSLSYLKATGGRRADQELKGTTWGRLFQLSCTWRLLKLHPLLAVADGCFLVPSGSDKFICTFACDTPARVSGHSQIQANVLLQERPTRSSVSEAPSSPALIYARRSKKNLDHLYFFALPLGAAVWGIASTTFWLAGHSYSNSRGFP